MTLPATNMRLSRASGDEAPRSELELIDTLLTLDGCRIVELGCGAAKLTRQYATAGTGREVLALEVDELQHAKNLEIDDLPNVRFSLGGAESIPAGDGEFDVAFMFKSLHHVPTELMGRALAELHRVLRPGGHAWISEPVFAGAFNEVLRLFHDEERVRLAAFEAVRGAVEQGLFELVEEVFFNVPSHFADFAEFERTVIGVSHTDHSGMSPELHARVREAFSRHIGPEGAHFAQPIRVDLLRKPLVDRDAGRTPRARAEEA